jgi:MYXO-CTERM domain-containing protein
MRRSLVFLFLAAVAVALGSAPRPAHAAPLLSGFGGPAGYGTGVLPGNDDGSSEPIDLLSAFPGGLRFFGGPYTQIWVNNNGNVTFAGPWYLWTPDPFPAAGRPMIAPYWADVDTRSATGGTDNLVYWHLEPGRMIVTWHNVGYFRMHNDRRMDFQLIITNTLDCGSGDFDIEFRYNRCEWETGDASGGSGGFGGTPAQAGFDAGNLTDFVEIMGSRMPGISTRLCTMSNVGVPGIWQFSVRSGGVVCPDAGDPCEVRGQIGPCAIGRTQCVGRMIECQPIASASPERCDGVDNDCDGEIDDGSGLCPGLEICSAGRCVAPCFEGGCNEGYTCDERGVCVETACIDVRCPEDQRCEGGRCVGVCEGIVCPHGQSCVAGRCIDLCAVVTCEPGQVCRDGICIPSCPCLPCGSDETCGADGRCIERGCDIVICEPGFYCADGVCHDACEGAVCPAGQRCELGECVNIPPPPDAGPPERDAGVVENDAGGGAGEDAGIDAGVFVEVDAGRAPPPMSRTSCACRAGAGGRVPAWAWAWAVLALAAAVIARRRR